MYIQHPYHMSKFIIRENRIYLLYKPVAGRAVYLITINLEILVAKHAQSKAKASNHMQVNTNNSSETHKPLISWHCLFPWLSINVMFGGSLRSFPIRGHEPASKLQMRCTDTSLQLDIPDSHLCELSSVCCPRTRGFMAERWQQSHRCHGEEFHRWLSNIHILLSARNMTLDNKTVNVLAWHQVSVCVSVHSVCIWRSLS